MKITIETTVQANLEKAWNCYTEPDHITKWNFASDDWQCPWAENDLRVGGKYRARMEAKDGSFGFEFEAVYDEIDHHALLRYTMPDGREVKTTFDEHDGMVHVKTIFDAENQNPVEMQQEGWQAILNNYKKHVEQE